ncbi:MAG: hypothetical protein HAW64_05645, partial [Alphaproteobacteria bacterium]|nr:hypothetical protein [Alphaproteobacteria bacterium]
MSSFAPSDSVPQIFDRARLLVNRRRHARAFYEHDFLHRQIAQELAQRLALFKQDFKTALCIGKSALLREALLKPAQITTLYGSDIGRDIDGDIGGDIDANAALI